MVFSGQASDIPEAIYHFDSRRYCPDVDVHEIRLANLQVLQGAMTRRQLAEHIGTGYEQIGHWFMRQGQVGHRNIGNRKAREIETKFKRPRGWLDQIHDEPAARQDAATYSINEEPSEFPVKGGALEVDQLDVRGSMGTGIPLPEREPVIDSIRVPVGYVRDNFPHITSPANLKIITGFGDSMLPTFKHGDPLIVDTGVITMDIDTVYVFAYQNELYIKGIQRLPDRSIKVISHNRAVFDPFVLDAKQREEVHVIGRVVCAVNMNKIS